jgi:hypothetical protein
MAVAADHAGIPFRSDLRTGIIALAAARARDDVEDLRVENKN